MKIFGANALLRVKYSLFIPKKPCPRQFSTIPDGCGACNFLDYIECATEIINMYEWDYEECKRACESTMTPFLGPSGISYKK
mgnify:CR=1 FL=1